MIYRNMIMVHSYVYVPENVYLWEIMGKSDKNCINILKSEPNVKMLLVYYWGICLEMKRLPERTKTVSFLVACIIFMLLLSIQNNDSDH